MGVVIVANAMIAVVTNFILFKFYNGTKLQHPQPIENEVVYEIKLN